MRFCKWKQKPRLEINSGTKEVHPLDGLDGQGMIDACPVNEVP